MAARDCDDDGWRQAIELLAHGHCTLLGLWGDAPQGAHGVVGRDIRRHRRRQLCLQRRKISKRRRAAIHRRFGSNAQSAICSVSKQWVRPIRGHGSILALGRAASARQTSGQRASLPRTYSCRPKAKACTRSRSARCMPASSSPGHFRFTANGEHVVRLEQRLGYVHKGIESLMDGATLERGGEARLPHLRRQHGGLCLCLRAGGGSRACR